MILESKGLSQELENFVQGRDEMLRVLLSDGTVDFESIRGILEDLGLNQQEMLTLGKCFFFLSEL